MNRIEQIEQFLQSQPNDSFLQHALALEYSKVGNDEKAKALFVNILNHNENYVGSYYHLAKLYERIHDEASAIATYEKGMEVAKKLQDNHSLGELRSAYEELTF
jgi:Tfp pilus assembly protein PilF